MKIVILTLCPEIFLGTLSSSIIGNGIKNKIWELNIVNIRDFTTDARKTVDDTCIGGGPGMLIKPDVTHEAIKHAVMLLGCEKKHLDSINFYENEIKTTQISDEGSNKIIEIMSKKITKIIETKIKSQIEFIHFSPRGKLLNQNFLQRYYKKNAKKSLIILCGRYEGIDQRVINYWNFQEISIGDYILTKGDIAATVFLDSYLRFLPGILGNSQSIEDESFSNNLLEANNYTKPINWNGISAPDVLLSGNHALIKSWKLEESKKITSLKRPDLWLKYLEKEEK